MEVELPTQFGRYELLKKLGEGGMGIVYLARDTQLDRQVALKIPSFSRHEDSVVLGRFYREARAAAALQHPNICPLFDVGEIDGVPYLTMAYIEGRPLSAVIRTGQRLNERQVAQLVRKVAMALEEAHRRGVIHRDLKPSNIMIDQRREPVIMDFGLARRTDRQETRLTQSGAMLGTPAYMAPEQVLGELEAIGPRTDVYSLGVILYELLTGRPPFEGGTTSVLAKIITQEPESPETIRPDLSAELAGICNKAMAKEVARRYGSMGELAGALTGYLKGRGGTAGSVVSEGALVGPAREALAAARSKGESQRLSGGEPLPILEPIDEEGADGVVELLPGIAPGGGPGPIDRRGATARQLGARWSWQWLRRYRAPLMVGCVGLALLAVALWALVGWDKDAEPAASQPAVVGPAPLAPLDAAQVRQQQEAWAKQLGVPVELTNSIGMKFVLIPPGQFDMGASDAEVEAAARLVERQAPAEAPSQIESLAASKPKHRVRITRPYYLGCYEVTVAQFRTFVEVSQHQTHAERDGRGGTLLDRGDATVGQLARRPELNWRSPGYEQAEDHPVVDVSFGDAGAFLWWLGQKEGKVYRLPTEAEWEYACRAGGLGEYGGGDDPERLVEVGNVRDGAWAAKHAGLRGAIKGDDGYGFTAPVGRFRPNAFGLYDVHGNVFEWCGDRFDASYYAAAPQENPVGFNSGAFRVVRGGSWSSQPVEDRCSHRRRADPYDSFGDTGFRVVCEIEGPYLRPIEIGPGGPLSRMALVTNPAVLPGVKSWTIETVGHHGPIYSVAYSPDSAILATGSEDGTVRLWSRDSDRPRVLVGHNRRVTGVAWSPQGNRLATASLDGAVRLWDANGCRPAGSLYLNSGELFDMAWSPDGRRLAAATGSNRAIVFDVGANRVVWKLEGHTDLVLCVAWSPDGKWVASGSEDKTVRLWEAASGKEAAVFQGHSFDVGRIRWSPNSTLLASAPSAYDHPVERWEIVLWDVAARQRRCAVAVGHGYCCDMAWSPDGQTLAAAGYQMMSFWDTESGSKLQEVGGRETPSALAWSPDGRELALGDWLSVTEVLDAQARARMRLFAGHPGDMSSDVAWSSDGKTLAATKRHGHLACWDVDSGWRVGSFNIQYGTCGLASSPDGAKLALGGTPKVVEIRDANSGGVLHSLEGHSAYIDSVVWSPDGAHLVSGDIQPSLKLWDAASGRLLPTLYAANWRAGFPPVFARDGKRVGVVTPRGEVEIQDVPQGQLLHMIPACGAETLAWSPDGKTLAVGAYPKQVLLWDADTWERRGELRIDVVPNALAWTPDGQQLAVADVGRIERWDFATRRRESISEMPAPYFRYRRPHNGLSPDRRYLACRGNDAAVRLAETATGRLLRVLLDISQEDYITVSSDGHYRGSPGVEKQLVYVVQTDLGQETLTPEEFARRFGWRNDPSRVKLGGAP